MPRRNNSTLLLASVLLMAGFLISLRLSPGLGMMISLVGLGIALYEVAQRRSGRF